MYPADWYNFDFVDGTPGGELPNLNAIPYIMYYDIYRNYYINPQDDNVPIRDRSYIPGVSEYDDEGNNFIQTEIGEIIFTFSLEDAIRKGILCEFDYIPLPYVLTEEEKVKLCQLCTQAGADFVKTSTGFTGGGATEEDVKLMRAHVAPTMQVKASGGVRTREDFDKMVAAGATRIGASAGVKIIEGK